MDIFRFMLKSYSGDIEYCKRLIESFKLHNQDSIILDIVVPKAEVSLFETLLDKNINVISEESIPVKFAQEYINGIRPGYINQEIVKLAFYKLRRTHSYLCLDSDAVFIRDFFLNDFINSSGRPYTVLVEDRALNSNPEYFKQHWQLRETNLKKISKYLGISEKDNLLTCHGFQIFDSDVLEKMEIELLSPRGLEFLDLLKISPYEFSWYNFFIQKNEIPVIVREPYFHVVHTGDQYAKELILGMDKHDFSRGYIGIVLNSNFQHFKSPQAYGQSKILAIALYMNFAEICRLTLFASLALAVRAVISALVVSRRLLHKITQR